MHLLAYIISTATAGLISIDDAKSLLIGLGVTAAAIVSITALLRLSFVKRPILWLWRRLVGEPVARWFHGLLDAWATDSGLLPRIERIEGQFAKNGGSSARDRLDAIGRAVGAPDPPIRARPLEELGLPPEDE